MVKFTVQDLLDNHSAVEDYYQFKHYEKGVRSEGLLQLIAERPYMTPYGYKPFPNVYSKCASLIEAIVKEQPFINGNKRTALVTARTFMAKNRYYMVIPIQSIKYFVIIAKDTENKIGVDRIAKWIRLLSSTNKSDYYAKWYKYRIEPAKMIANLYDSNRASVADLIHDDWFAYYGHLEYGQDKDKNIEFLYKIAKGEYTLKH